MIGVCGQSKPEQLKLHGLVNLCSLVNEYVVIWQISTTYFSSSGTFSVSSETSP